MNQPQPGQLIVIAIIIGLVGFISWKTALRGSDNPDVLVGAVSSSFPSASPSPSWSPSPSYSPTYSPSYSPQPTTSASPSPAPGVKSVPPKAGDVIAPSIPQNLSIADVYATATRDVLLVWDRPSTDNVAVTGYKIYRNGVFVNQVDSIFEYGPYATSTLPSFTGTFVYTITASDAAGNESGQSNSTLYKSPGVGTRIKLSRDIANSSGTIVFPKDSTGIVVSPFPHWYNSNIIHHAILFDDANLMGVSRFWGICGGVYGECPGNMGVVYIEYNGAFNSYPLIDDSVITILPPLDTTVPNVTVTAPAPSATLSGTTNFTANASDNVGVTGVQFYVDNVAVGAEDVSAPYLLAWNTFLVPNGPHFMHTVARDAAGNQGLSQTVPFTVTNSGLDPSKKPWQNFNLDKWKIQLTAKNPPPTDYFMRRVASSSADQLAVAPWFFTNPDGSMAFWLNAAKPNNLGTSYRTELREVMDGTTNNTNWSALLGTSTLTADIKIPFTPTYNASTTQITVAQIHPLSGDPLLRVVWYKIPNAGRYLKVHYKTDAAGLVDASAWCPTQTAGLNTKFSINIVVANGKMTVTANNQACLNNFTIHPDWTQTNYFKAGNYASQSYDGIGQVDFYKLEVTHSVPGI